MNTFCGISLCILKKYDNKVQPKAFSLLRQFVDSWQTPRWRGMLMSTFCCKKTSSFNIIVQVAENITQEPQSGFETLLNEIATDYLENVY